MNTRQSREFLSMKLQTRVNEAKCKALIDDKLLSNLFAHDIQQMHYETVHKKLEMAYGMKKLSVAHNKYLCTAIEQYSKAIKSNQQLLKTVNTQINTVMDKEKDLLELREETILGVKETMELEFNSILHDDSDNDDDDNTTYLQLLPPVPMCEPDRDEKPKKSLSFGNVIIKTIDEAEFEHQESEEKQNKSTHEFIDDIEQENVTQII